MVSLECHTLFVVVSAATFSPNESRCVAFYTILGSLDVMSRRSARAYFAGYYNKWPCNNLR